LFGDDFYDAIVYRCHLINPPMLLPAGRNRTRAKATGRAT
jgi:hypothetical protein